MKTLTLWPEWAFAICHLGKRVENRSLPFSEQIARRVGDGWLAIHAGKSIGGRPGPRVTREGIWSVSDMAVLDGWDLCDIDSEGGLYVVRRERYVRLAADEIVTSAVVAITRVDGALKPGDHALWKVVDSAAVRLRDVRALSEPLPMGGKQGLWCLTPEQAEVVLARAGVS